MPDSVPDTCTIALTDATCPMSGRSPTRERAALRADAGLAKGLSAWDGHLVSEPVGLAQGIPTGPPATALG